MENAIELKKYEWLEFITWYEESYHYCDWLPSSSGTNVTDAVTEEVIASKTNIPEMFFVSEKYYILSPRKI